METWRLLDTGARSGAENMALDETLLELKAAERIPPTLRFLQFSTPTGRVLPKSLWVQLSRSGLPSETLKSGSLEVGVSAGSAKGIILKVLALLLIFQRGRFKFSPERPPLPIERNLQP